MPAPELPSEVSVEEVNGLLDAAQETRPRLVDCREEDEWRICRIEGAELVPLSQFGELAAARFTDPDQHVIIYCHHGMRSLRAANWLRQQGFSKAQSMRGGIELWADRIDPGMARY
ncbi:MAG TPA: rhodanese-like domain-containing protein [Prosthecobacter sp.]